MDTFRDTFIGQTLRLLFGQRLLKYPDEINPKPYRSTIIKEASLTRSNTNAEWTLSRNPNIVDSTRPVIDHRTTSGRAVPRTHIASQEEQENIADPRGPSGNSPSNSGVNPDAIAASDIDMSKIETQKTLGDTSIVTWLDDDPLNPQNWSFVKKCWATSQICFLTFTIYIGSAIYTAGTEGVQEHFNVSQTVAVLGLTLFVLGYGTGPMFLCGFAEAPPIGRTPVYILSVLAFTLFNLGVLWAKNIGMLLAFRFITGFVGSPVLATGGSSLADIWSEKKRMYAIGVWGIFAVGGPVLGPLIGGFAAEFKGWQWPILELIWLNAFCTLLLAFCLPETSAATILYKRAKRLRKALADTTLESEAEIEAKGISKATLVKGMLVLPFQLSFQEPILFFTNLYLGLVYAILYCWFEAFPLTFIGVYGWSLGVSGLAYIGLLVGAVVSIAGYAIWLRLSTEKAMDNGTMTPEKRLPAACVGSLFLPICMFYFGWTAKESVHWINPIVASSFFSIGACLLFNSILNYQADAYPRQVSSCSSHRSSLH